MPIIEFSVGIYEPDIRTRIFQGFSGFHGNLALEHYIDSYIADQVEYVRRYNYGEVRCPFAGSVQTGCGEEECVHTKKWKDQLHLGKR